MLCESVYQWTSGRAAAALGCPWCPHPTSKQYHVKVTCTVRFSPSRDETEVSRAPTPSRGLTGLTSNASKLGFCSLSCPKPPPPLPQVQVEGFVSPPPRIQWPPPPLLPQHPHPCVDTLAPPTVYTLLLDARHPAPASPSSSPASAPSCAPLPSAPLAAAWCVCAPGPCVTPPRCFCTPPH